MLICTEYEPSHTFLPLHHSFTFTNELWNPHVT